MSCDVSFFLETVRIECGNSELLVLSVFAEYIN